MRRISRASSHSAGLAAKSAAFVRLVFATIRIRPDGCSREQRADTLLARADVGLVAAWAAGRGPRATGMYSCVRQQGQFGAGTEPATAEIATRLDGCGF